MKMKSLLAAAVLPALMICGAAATANAAQSVLYRNDDVIGADYLGQAVNSGAYNVTSTSGDLSGYNLSDYNIVVYANQGSYIQGNDLAQLDAYIAAGGHVIFDDWTGSSAFTGNEAFNGDLNQTSLTLSMFNNGVSSPLAVSNPGWGIFATGLDALPGGVVAGTFGDGTGAIIVGNNGRTIVNGFLSDTVASEQLYANELGSLGGAVPEPATWAMLILGLGMVGFAARRRQGLALAA